MNKIVLLLSFNFLWFSNQINAQTQSLPYSTGFDSTSEQSGWTEYKLGFDGTYDWIYSTGNPFSAPTSLWHDYQVGGSSTDTVRDWFVSPPLDFSSTGKISLKVNRFTFGVQPIDYFGIWFSSGDSDPNVGDYVEIADLTNFSTSGQYKDTTINIPFTAVPGYIALKYQATDNWFTINIDDILVTADSLSSINEDNVEKMSIRLYPNPFTYATILEIDDHFQFRHARLMLFNSMGEKIAEQKINTKKSKITRNNLASGIYYYQIINENNLTNAGKLIIQ